MLITEEYREMQRKLHENPGYGVASVSYAPLVADVIRSYGATELLDYGAGKGRLGQTLKKHIQAPLKITHYDPAIPQWSGSPEPCEMVACIDVLEHIEPTLLDNVLDDLKRVTRRHGVFTVHTQPAVKVLLDGRNAHLIQQPPRWWLPRFMDRFELLAFNKMPNGFWIVVACKQSGRAQSGAVLEDAALMVADVASKVGVKELLDYGARTDRLAVALRELVDAPPGVSRCAAAAARSSQPASPSPMVACLDVLEDVEPGRLDAVLDDLRRVTQHFGVFTVRTDAAAGGSAAPANLQPVDWWLTRFLDRFELLTFNRMPAGFAIVVERKNV